MFNDTGRGRTEERSKWLRKGEDYDDVLYISYVSWIQG
jgi:hypothetical protein